MAADKPRSVRANRVEPARPRGKDAPADRPFDMWLHKQLHAMYDEIAAEPLPNDLLKMIDHDAESGGNDDTGSPGKKP